MLRSVDALSSNLPQQHSLSPEESVLRARIVPCVKMADKMQERWATFESMRE